jgi:hypothetical protein
MNRLIKTGIAALAIAAVAPAFADEVEDEGVVGWTPLAIGLATPVQLPWGIERWDVFGLDVNLLYTDTPKMYGLGIGGLGMTTRDDLIGVGVGGLFNYASKDVNGLRATLGANICRGTLRGLDVGLVGYHHVVRGVDFELLGGLYDEMYGVQAGLLVNFAREMNYGLSAAVGVNIAHRSYGCQAALVFNHANVLNGCQLGLVNFADECEWGFQVGLINVIMSNKVKVLPIVNGYF